MRTNFPESTKSRWTHAVALALLLGPAGMAAAQEPAAVPPVTPPATQSAPPASAPATDPTLPTAVTPEAASPTAAQTAPAAAAPVAGAAKPGGKKAHAVKVKVKKVKPPPMFPVTVERGVLTVDGWTGKARLNYSIMDLKYLYLWAPGIGTAVVSSEPFPNAQLQAGAFNGHTLTVAVGGHTLQLASDRNLLSGKELIKPAYVALDTTYVPEHANYPAFGYGVTSKAPYAWPASMVNYTGDVSRAPPLPESMLPPLKPANCTPAAATASTTPADTTTPAAAAPAPAAAPAATGSAKVDPCSAAPKVMYPGKSAKRDQALTKQEKKKNEKLDDSYK